MTETVKGLPKDQHDYGMAQGHMSIALGVVMVDFDGTIVPWGPLMGEKKPYHAVATAMAALFDNGYRIGIFTSRLSPTWCAHAKTTVEEQLAYVKDILDSNHIAYHFITAEKVPALVYFDDMAIRVEPGELARELSKFLDKELQK